MITVHVSHFLEPILHFIEIVNSDLKICDEFITMKIVTESAIDNPQGFSHTKKISVQSSFKLNLPPPLIFEASTIKLDETIGQGKNYNHNSRHSETYSNTILL